MAGSDRVLDPNDSKRAQVGKRKNYHESEMALFSECMLLCAQRVLDRADIVRDGDFATVIAKQRISAGRRMKVMKSITTTKFVVKVTRTVNGTVQYVQRTDKSPMQMTTN